MNDGFIVFWIVGMAAILYVTGWEEQVANGIPLRVVGIYIGAACVLQFVTIAIRSDIIVTGSAVLAIGTALGLLISMRQPGGMLFVLFSSLLTGFMWTWMRYMYAMDPVFIVIDPRWDGPLLAGLFAGLLMDRFQSHLIIVTLSSFLTLSYLDFGPGMGSSPLLIGTLSWWDGLAISLAAARITGNVKMWIRERVLSLVESRSGEQGGRS